MIALLSIIALNVAFFGTILWCHLNPVCELEEGDL